MSDITIGRNATLEALKSGKKIDEILISNGDVSGSIKEILAKAKEKKILIKRTDKRKLDAFSNGAVHQGVLAFTEEKSTCEISDILKIAKNKGEDPFIVIANEIEDPHNLGAIIRTAECAGVHGVIIPKRRSAGLTEIVNKTSAGALEHMAIAKVTNIASTIDYLKSKGIWVYGTDANGENIFEKKEISGSVALVIGSEGQGLGRLVREKCDLILSLPMKGKISSLNASVAAGILMYEVARYR